MITKEEFSKFISKYQSFKDAIDRFGEALGGKSFYYLFETDWYEDVAEMLDTFIDSHFTEKGADWIYYYLFEDIDDHRVFITKGADLFNGEAEIEYHLNSIDELWDFLLNDTKLYFKNA
jgi:hypothetical protein